MFCNSLQYREKPNIIVNFFTYSSGVLLLITSTAKFVSASGHAGILTMGNPILSIPFRDVLWIAGSLELVVALVSLLFKQHRLKLWLIAWLATCFLMYHIGSLLMYETKFCPCLGNLTDALHISPQVSDIATKILLAYLLLGSYAAIFWTWWRTRRTTSTLPSVDRTVSVT
jgi:hypothetical protein